MSVTIRWIEKWRTNNDEVLAILTRDDRTRYQAQELLNELSNHRKELRAWLDACDAMEKAALK